jgi:hypothetical protein
MSCKSTTYIVLGYDKPDVYDTSSGYVYLLQRTKFPKLTKKLYTTNTCPCIMSGDIIFFTRENDSLVPNKINTK